MQEQIKPKKKKLSEQELLEMAREMNPELGNDFLTEKERNAKEFFSTIKLI